MRSVRTLRSRTSWRYLKEIVTYLLLAVVMLIKADKVSSRNVHNDIIMKFGESQVDKL